MRWVGIQTQSILNFKIEDLLGMRNFFSRPVIITSVMGLLSIFPQRIIYGCGMDLACWFWLRQWPSHIMKLSNADRLQQVGICSTHSNALTRFLAKPGTCRSIFHLLRLQKSVVRHWLTDYLSVSLFVYPFIIIFFFSILNGRLSRKD